MNAVTDLMCRVKALKATALIFTREMQLQKIHFSPTYQETHCFTFNTHTQKKIMP